MRLKKKKYKVKVDKKIYLSLLAVMTLFFSFQFNAEEASAACSYPAQILDLNNWKETLPTGSSESPTEIKQPTLATYLQSPFFTANTACDGVVFRAPVNGVTTSGSGYPRSELREMTNSGATNASWSTTSGAHSMTTTQAITAVPKSKKHVIAGQIHDANDDVIVVRLEYPKLFIDINGTTGPTLDANYTLGKKFTVQFVAADGKIKVYYNGNQQPVYTLTKSNSGNYFKAGAYTQSNCSKETVCDSSNYGEVVIYNLKLQHQTSSSTPIAIASPSATTTASAPATTSNTTTVTTGTQTPSGLSFEAESGIISSPMTVVSDSSASNGKYIVQTSDTDTGSAKYSFTVPTDGKYSLRSRVISPNGSSNSFNYSLDAGQTNTWNLPENIGAWTWVEGSTINLTKGAHTLTVNKREKNTKIDSFEIKPYMAATISLEAESGTISGGMNILSDTSASGGKYVKANSTGAISYLVDVIESGTYRIAGLIKAANSTSDSFYVSMNNGSSSIWTLPISATTWLHDTDENRTFSLSAGMNNLTIKYREAGAMLDKIMLIKQ